MFIDKIYASRTSDLRRGGIEVNATRAKIWIGIALFVGLILLFEIIYLVIPTPLQFVIENAAVAILVVFAILAIYLIGVPFFKVYNSYYELAPNHVVAVHGVLLSTRRREHLIPYELINGYKVKQNIFGRLFNFGTLEIGTAMTGVVECQLRDIQNPQKIMNQLDERRRRNKEFKYIDLSKFGNGSNNR